MSKTEKWTEADDLEVLQETRQKLAAIEREWKQLRETSKATTLRLITDWGYSVNRAAVISGHQRPTITTWLQVHNAGLRVQGKQNG